MREIISVENPGIAGLNGQPHAIESLIEDLVKPPWLSSVVSIATSMPNYVRGPQYVLAPFIKAKDKFKNNPKNEGDNGTKTAAKIVSVASTRFPYALGIVQRCAQYRKVLHAIITLTSAVNVLKVSARDGLLLFFEGVHNLVEVIYACRRCA